MGERFEAYYFPRVWTPGMSVAEVEAELQQEVRSWWRDAGRAWLYGDSACHSSRRAGGLGGGGGNLPGCVLPSAGRAIGRHSRRARFGSESRSRTDPRRSRLVPSSPAVIV